MSKYCLEISFMYIYISVKLFICLVCNYMNDNEIYCCHIVTGSYCSWCSFYSHSWGKMYFCSSTFKTPLLLRPGRSTHDQGPIHTNLSTFETGCFYLNWPFVLIKTSGSTHPNCLQSSLRCPPHKSR